mmetsp:Transcript_8400/g.52508  ORF Transcript_8400/g.52508 Transcript_8400/m.52508 type:complete len:267 (-) Transcript_8400:72-872(-)
MGTHTQVKGILSGVGDHVLVGCNTRSFQGFRGHVFFLPAHQVDGIGEHVHSGSLGSGFVDADLRIRHTSAVLGLGIGFVLDLSVASCRSCTSSTFDGAWFRSRSFVSIGTFLRTRFEGFACVRSVDAVPSVPLVSRFTFFLPVSVSRLVVRPRGVWSRSIVVEVFLHPFLFFFFFPSNRGLVVAICFVRPFFLSMGYVFPSSRPLARCTCSWKTHAPSLCGWWSWLLWVGSDPCHSSRLGFPRICFPSYAHLFLLPSHSFASVVRA